MTIPSDDSGKSSPMLRPTLFLDIDEILCLSRVYGGRHAAQALSSKGAVDAEHFPWTELFEREACETLRVLMAQSHPRVVMTSTWLTLFNQAAMAEVFRRTGLESVAVAFHARWDAPQNRFETRLSAIERWLRESHEGESFVVLDDPESGTGLAGSALDRNGHVVLCEVGRGLHKGHLPDLLAALNRPVGSRFR